MFPSFSKTTAHTHRTSYSSFSTLDGFSSACGRATTLEKRITARWLTARRQWGATFFLAFAPSPIYENRPCLSGFRFPMQDAARETKRSARLSKTINLSRRARPVILLGLVLVAGTEVSHACVLLPSGRGVTMATSKLQPYHYDQNKLFQHARRAYNQHQQHNFE